ncbi:MAG: class I SAM-dependent methyltransferase [Bacteroidetes bacterium]|nr:class I SAM-dependent methyltransferase [Bacteroidota bacterium]
MAATKKISNALQLIGFKVSRAVIKPAHKKIYRKYSEFTMTPPEIFFENLLLSENHLKNISGDIVECGVWRGGMIAGIAEALKGQQRKYFLFDSFEGLPPAKEIDGERATKWQSDTTGDFYYDNCRAEQDFAIKAMSATGSDYKLIKGWFENTLPEFNGSNNIALLRLDGDWYESISISLKFLFPLVVKGGLIIIDDYLAWDGCSKAVHDYLSSIKSASKIRTTPSGVTYLIKSE